MKLLKNGIIMTMTQPKFIGDILIDGKRIVSVEPHILAPDAEIIDVSNCYVLPGFVEAHCHLGMWEDGIGEEGADGNECSDPITPHLRAIDGLNPFDPCFAEARAAGITSVLSGPGSSNVIGGQFVAIKTAGRCIEEMIIKQPAAMKAAFGENPKREYGDQKVAPYTRMAIVSLFRKTMVEAQEYQRKLELAGDDEEKLPERDVGLESLLPVLSGELTVKAHVHRADDILTALRLAREYHLKMTLEHCTEGHLIVDVLKEQLKELDVGVILGPLLSDRAKIELKNLSFQAPKILHDAGIPFALMTDHPVTPLQYLPVCAALAVRAGLDEETALKSITIHAANITGIGEQVGSLVPGKDADIAVFNGFPLDYQTHCTMTFINGQLVHRLD